MTRNNLLFDLVAKQYKLCGRIQTSLPIASFLEKALHGRARFETSFKPHGAARRRFARCNLICQLELLHCLGCWSARSARREWMHRLLQKCPLSRTFHSYLLSLVISYQCSLTVDFQDAFLYQEFTGAVRLPSRAQRYPNGAVFSRSASDCGENLFPLEAC